MVTTEEAGRAGAPTARSGRLKAAWVLVLLAPLSAEAAFSGVYLPLILVALPLLVPIYGAGVLLVRELVCRAGAGWPGLLVLGVAYELVEDGLGLRALTSPHLYTAAEWGPRVLGLNTTYWESQIGYHLVFTVLIPVLLTDLIFPAHRGRPYLRGFGLAGAAVVTVVGVGLVRVLIAGTEDPGYQQPLAVDIGLVVAIGVLGVLGTVVVPRWRRPARERPDVRVPRPVVGAVVAGLAPIAFMVLLFPMGHDVGRPAIGAVPTSWVVVPMVVAAALAVAAGWLVLRWSRASGFTDSHRLWLIGGALVGHSVLAVGNGLAGGAVALPVGTGAVVIAVTVLFLLWVGRRMRRNAGVATG